LPPILEAQPLGPADAGAALLDRRTVVYPAGAQETPFYRGESLLPGNRVIGPAIVVRSDTTILVGPSDQAEVDVYGDLWIDIGTRE